VTIDQARWLRVLARWHRRIALVVCIWLVVLAASGLLINHAHDWGLDRSSPGPTLQRLLYGVESDGEEFCNDAASLGPECAEVFAQLPLPAGELLVGRKTLFLIDTQGDLVEKLAAAQLGLGDVEAAVASDSSVYLRDAKQTVKVDEELLDWQVVDAAAIAHLQARDWRVGASSGETISWERFLLDLHAARFIGPLAKGFTDLMGGLILLLALSGLWLWWIRRKRD